MLPDEYDLDAMINAYLECAIFASTDDDGRSLTSENFDVSDFDDAARDAAREDCEAFLADNLDKIPRDRVEDAGRDLWLSRNGHGAGFFDGDWDDDGDELQRAARAYGSCDVIVLGEYDAEGPDTAYSGATLTFA